MGDARTQRHSAHPTNFEFDKEGSRTMRNRPYPVLKCSRNGGRDAEIRSAVFGIVFQIGNQVLALSARPPTRCQITLCASRSGKARPAPPAERTAPDTTSRLARVHVKPHSRAGRRAPSPHLHAVATTPDRSTSCWRVEILRL